MAILASACLLCILYLFQFSCMVYSDNRDGDVVALRDEDVRIDITSYGPMSSTGTTNISIDISIELYTYNRDEEYYVKIFSELEYLVCAGKFSSLSKDKIHCTKDSSFLRDGDNRFRVLITSLPKAVVVLDTISHCFYSSPPVPSLGDGVIDYVRDQLSQQHHHHPKVLVMSGALIALLLYRSSRSRRPPTTTATANPVVEIEDDNNSGAYPPDSPTDGPLDRPTNSDDPITTTTTTTSTTTFLHPIYSLTQRLYKSTSQYQYPRPGHLTAWVFYLGILPFLFRPTSIKLVTGGGGGLVPTSILETPSYLPSSSGSSGSSSSSSRVWEDSIRRWIVAIKSAADQGARSSLASVGTKASLLYPKAQAGFSTIHSHLQALHTRVQIKMNSYTHHHRDHHDHVSSFFKGLSSRPLPSSLSSLEPYLTHVSKVIEQNPLLKAELYSRQQVSKLKGVYATTPDNLKVIYSIILLIPFLLLKKTILRPKTPPPTKWSPDWVRRKPKSRFW